MLLKEGRRIECGVRGEGSVVIAAVVGGGGLVVVIVGDGDYLCYYCYSWCCGAWLLFVLLLVVDGDGIVAIF